jgi:hypothetical protein
LAAKGATCAILAALPRGKKCRPAGQEKPARENLARVCHFIGGADDIIGK